MATTSTHPPTRSTTLSPALTPNVEPRKRLCGGELRWVSHRFPINGGVTAAVVYADALLRMTLPTNSNP